MINPLIIIPARSGSKRLPGKNFRRLCGQTLLARCVATARDVLMELGAGRVVTVLDRDHSPSDVSTCWGLSNIMSTHIRPDSLKGDDVGTQAVVQDVLLNYNGYDPIVLMQCTSPFTLASHVVDCIERFYDDRTLMVCSTIPDTLGQPSGQCWVFSRRMTRQENLFSRNHFSIPSPSSCIDINTEVDLKQAQALLDGNHGNRGDG